MPCRTAKRRARSLSRAAADATHMPGRNCTACTNWPAMLPQPITPKRKVEFETIALHRPFFFRASGFAWNELIISDLPNITSNKWLKLVETGCTLFIIQTGCRRLLENGAESNGLDEANELSAYHGLSPRFLAILWKRNG